MKRHKFNIFPEAKQEDYERLRQDIADNGFDASQPIVIYQGDILDGWNRQKACNELNVKPTYETFKGSDEEAIAFMMRTNKRRNLNSGQWSCIAVEAEELVKAIQQEVEKQRRAKQAETQERTKKVKEAVVQKIVPQTPKDTSKLASHKTAQLFNTNRTYVNQATKLKTQAPEVFEQVKAGKMRMTDATKAVRAIPTDPWRKDERERQEQVKKGFAVVANQQGDKNLIQWAESNGKAVRIDRGTKYGNPFILDADGDRDCVCDNYEHQYLPLKPSILSSIETLKGKVLICHCFPQRCHGDSLAKMANE
jgi:hypothetical protein